MGVPFCTQQSLQSKLQHSWPENISLILVEEVGKRETILFGDNKGAGRGCAKTTEGWVEIQKVLAAR